MPKNVERYPISVSSPDRVESVEEKISLLTRNLFRQYDKLNELILLYTSGREKFELTPALILKLHYFAMESIVPDAGKFRSGDVIISVSGHSPPPAEEVPRLVQELCDYVRVNWFEKSALHLASYCLWRLNWIHPFSEGNGVTARALSYLVLSIRLGVRLPGYDTIPVQISESKEEYYGALEHADEAYRRGQIDVSELEALLEKMMARQLISASPTSP